MSSIGLVMTRRRLTSACLLHWRAADRSLAPLFGAGTPTLTRAATGAQFLDTRGRLISAVHSQPRWASAYKDGPVGLLLEDATTNLIANSENFGAWTVTGTPVLTSGQKDPAGGTGAYLIEDNDGAATESILLAVTVSSSGRKGMSVYVKKGTAAAFAISFHDNTAGVHRHQVSGVWQADGSIVLSTLSGAGELWTPIECADGWWRIECTATGVVSGNSNRMFLYPAGVTAANTGTTYFFGAQVEDAETCTSYVRTTGSTATRTAEDFVLSDAKIAPKPTTVYQRWTEMGTGMKMVGARAVLNLKGASGRYFHINRIGDSNRGYRVEWTASNNATINAASLQAGDLVEMLMSISDTTGLAELAVNGVSVGTVTADISAAAYWPSLEWRWPSSAATGRGFALYHALKVARGVRTLNQMRELV